MQKLRRNFERFCYRHRRLGIPNLMLFVAIGNLVVYLLSTIDPSGTVYRLFYFDPSKILDGEIWRLVTYIFTDLLGSSNIGLLFSLLMLFFYFQIGRILEARWGAFRFNLFYFFGILIMDVAGLILHCRASTFYLNLSLILAYATIFPENMVWLFYIIPLKMKYLAWAYFALTAYEIIVAPIPYNFFPLFALMNYFLFFGSDIRNVLPRMTRVRPMRPPVRPQQPHSGPGWASKYQSAAGQKPYHHKCCVCGRTDTEYPDLEFRYFSDGPDCSCYCQDHIDQHKAQ